MPSPAGSDQYTRDFLSSVSHAFLNANNAYVARSVFPPLPVNKQTGKIGTYSREDFLRDEMQERAPASESAGSGYTVNHVNYDARVYAHHKDVAREDIANAGDPYRPLEDAARFVTTKRLVRMETEFAAKFVTAGVWDRDLVAGVDFTAWSNPASDPVGDVAASQEAIESQTGLFPNSLVLNRRGWHALRDHPDVIARISGGGNTSAPAVASLNNVATVLGVDRIVVGTAVSNTGPADGVADVDYIFGNHALLVYTTSSPGLYSPSAGYVVEWTGQGEFGQSVDTLDMPLKKAVRVEIEAAFQMLAAAPLLGALFQNIV